MRRAIPFLSTVVAVIGLASGGCGSDESKIERGLAPAGEAATPQSQAELEMTEGERQQKLEREMEQAEEEAFDREAGDR